MYIYVCVCVNIGLTRGLSILMIDHTIASHPFRFAPFLSLARMSITQFPPTPTQSAFITPSDSCTKALR